jgi:hypothetical protein
VMAEQQHMRNVADGKAVPLNASNQPPAPPQRAADTASPAAPASAATGEQVALLR